MTTIEVPCPTCSATGESTHEDRHAGTNMDTCRTCGGRRTIPARPGESRETSWPFAVPGAKQPGPEIVRHVRTGGLYEVLFRGAVIHSDGPLFDDAAVAVCRRVPDGQIVVRPGMPPRGSLELLHHSRLQTDNPLPDGSEVAVYRTIGGAGPVWVRPTSEMDGGRFEPDHPDSATPSGDGAESSTSGEIEGLVDRLTDAAIRLGRDQIHGDPDDEAASSALFDVARTALLSRIVSTPTGGNAAQQRDCLLEFLRGAGVRLGVIDPRIACDAPQLMTAMDAYFDHLAALNSADANPQE